MTPSSATPYTVHGELPLLDSPTLIIMMSGWIDASGAAAGAMQHLINATASRDLINFDGDTFVDYRARRPLMELREGVNTRIVWSVPEMRVGTDDDGRDVLLLNLESKLQSAWVPIHSELRTLDQLVCLPRHQMLLLQNAYLSRAALLMCQQELKQFLSTL